MIKKKKHIKKYKEVLDELNDQGAMFVTGGDLNSIPPGADSRDFCIEDMCSEESFHTDTYGGPQRKGSYFNNFDGEPDAPYYNSYAQYGINRPIGGNVLLETSLNLIFKVPFIEDQSQFRTAFFIDLGNVFSTFCYNYQTQCFTPNFKDLRGSYGLGGSAITPFGPVSVYFAVPFNNDPLDRTKRFEFTVGNKF